MKRSLFFISFTCLATLAVYGRGVPHKEETKGEIVETLQEEAMPKYLYKILSMRNWQASQHTNAIQLSAEDHTCIHFS
jgi:hypothetical protein